MTRLVNWIKYILVFSIRELLNKVYKVLFSAFSCLPDRGSEPGVGWNWAIQAAQNIELDVTVLTRTKCRTKIEPAREKLGLNNLHFLYVPSSARLREKSIYFEYVAWQRAAYNYIKKNYGPDDFDCLWHITFGNVFLPIWIHKLPYKFVWGPMGGGEHVRPAFYKTFPFRSSLPHKVKYALIKTSKLNPIVQGPAKKASLILARTDETKALFRDAYQLKTQVTLETRMDESSIPLSCRSVMPFEDGRLHICYTGRLIALKNVDKLVSATASLLDEGAAITLHLVGEGPMQRELEKTFERHVVANSIIFHGHLARDEALKIVASCPVFAFPSLREGGSWSLMEAMILGRAIFCFDSSGMHEMVNQSSALLIPMTKPTDVEGQFKSAMRTLAGDSCLVASLGAAARARAKEIFSWDDARTKVASVVKQICEG